MKMKLKKVVPSASCLVLSAKKMLTVALCAVGLSAFAADPLGSKGNPWDIGTPTAGDVEAWTNGTGRLDINGTGAMIDFQSAAPWAGDALSESVVGSDVTVIGANAFAGCPGLKTLVLNEQTPPTLGAGNDFAADVTIFVAAGAADAYRADSGWSKYATQIEEMHTKKGPDNKLTTHLYEMTYKWWDAEKANDIGEELAALMEKIFNWQEEQDDYFFPYQFFTWYEGFASRALCTSCRNGNFVGRNFDWGYDDVDECVLRIPAAEGHLASIGVASWFFPKWMQEAFDVDSFLPELTMDGVNEMGVAINVNVVPGGDNGWTTNTNPKATKRLNAGFAVRTVLDNATNAAHAVEILQSRDIYSLKPLEFHWMISDATESYIVECAKSKLVVMRAHEARPKMSNYYVSHSPSRGEYDVLTNADLTATAHTPHAMGIERYANVSNGLEFVDSVEEMYTHMTNVWYKPKFLPGNERKYWSDMNGAPIPDEFGQSTGERFEFNDGYDTARSNAFKQIQANYVAVTNYEAKYNCRTIDQSKPEGKGLTNEVVHTVHTSIYDIEKRMLRVVVQEDAAYSFDAYLTPPKQEISTESDEFAVDLRPRVEFEKGKTRIDVVTWSATAWGAVPGSQYTNLGFTNLTTGATGVIAEGLVGENLDDCPLPEKDGEYLLTHSTGDLKSFVTFTVSGTGNPVGSKENPWVVGKTADDSVAAYTNGVGGVVVEGEGDMRDFDPSGDPAPWGTDVTEVEIGGNVTGVGANAFKGSTSLTNVTVLANTPPAMGADAFSGCDAIETINVPKGTGEVYKAAPGWSDFADKIIEQGTPENPWKVGDGVTAYIDESGTLHVDGEGAMTDFSDGNPAPWTAVVPPVTSAEIGEGVTGIGTNAFKDCASLTNVTVLATVPQSLGGGAFSGCDGLAKILVPWGTGDDYRAASDWSEYAEKILEMPGSAENPWTLGEGVTAWVDPSLTNIAGLVICNGLPEENRPIDLDALTDAMEKAMYLPAVTPLNALVKTSEGAVAMPAKWTDAKPGTSYGNLEAAILRGVKTVTPDFGSAPPRVIVEEVEVAPGVTVTATMRNDGSGVSGAVQALGAEGLADFAEARTTSVELDVTAKSSVPTASQLLNAAEKALNGRSTTSTTPHYVDISLWTVAADGAKTAVHELDETLAILIPWTFEPNHANKVVRSHNGTEKAFTETPDENGEYVEFDKANGLITVHSKFFSDFAVVDFALATVRITVPAAGSLPEGVNSITVKANGMPVQPTTTSGGTSTYEIAVGLPVEVDFEAKSGYAFPETGESTWTWTPEGGIPAGDKTFSAEEIAPTKVRDPLPACVYRFRAHVYTTKGVTQNMPASGSACAPGGTVCVVMRGRDKTVIEGWLYQCECVCDGLGESAVIWDAYRKVPLSDAAFETQFLNVIGSRSTDAEWAWTFTGTAVYDSLREQDYELAGSGYGAFNPSAGICTSFSGAFAGTASASYDLVTKRTAATADCVCQPSQVLKCDAVDGVSFELERTAAFGQWKVKYDATASKAYQKGGRLSIPSYVK